MSLKAITGRNDIVLAADDTTGKLVLASQSPVGELTQLAEISVKADTELAVDASGLATSAKQAATIDAIEVVGTPLQRDPGEYATGSVTVAQQPSDTNTLTISDGVLSKVFEFDDDVTITAGRVRVEIGNNVNQTAGNLCAAVLWSGLALTDLSAAAPICAWRNNTVGVVGNVAITTTCGGGVLTLVGMSGGRNPVTSQVLGDSLAAMVAATQTSPLALSDPIALTASLTVGKVGAVDGILGAVALDAGIKVLTLIPSDAAKVINWAIGKAATAGTAVWPANGASIRGTKAQLDLVQFFAASAVNVSILQEG